MNGSCGSAGGRPGSVGGPSGIARLLACVVARELRDGEIVAFGLHAELMLAAAFLAQRLHAPNLILRHGLRVERGIEIGPAAWTEDPRNRSHESIEYLEAHDAILDVANPDSPMRFCDVFFAGGLQIDREGSTNLIGIKGKDGRMAVRGPGSIGTTSLATLARHVILFSGEHTTRRFVERVDYVSVPGWRRRAAAGLEGGPSLCVTPFAVMDFADGSMRLRSVHAHATVEEVRRRTGFHLGPEGKIPVTLPPTAAERAALEAIDPDGRLDRLPFGPDGEAA
jgi:glutaconate CoA-transferase, subunit B